MLPNTDILESLFATVATIIATLTGLIGAFSTLRMQTILKEIDLLKDLMLAKKITSQRTLKDHLTENNYGLLEKLYNLDLRGIKTIEYLILNDLSDDSIQTVLLFDLDNIKRNQLLHDKMKQLILSGVIKSILFVFISLVLLTMTNILLRLDQNLWYFLLLYMTCVALLFYLYIKQLKYLI